MSSSESVLQHRVNLGALLGTESFTEMVQSFVDLYRVSIKVFDTEGNKLADVKVDSGDLCGYVFGFPEGRRRCTATVNRVKDGPVMATHGARPTAFETDLQQKTAGMVVVPCFTGLKYLISPIHWEGDFLGRVVFGPFTLSDTERFPPSTLTEISPQLEVPKSRELIAKMPRMLESTVAKVMLHFNALLQTLLFVGQKMFFTTQMHIESTLEHARDLEEKNTSLNETNEQLKELDRTKSTFLATVSHELRTPLTSIIGYSEMLAEGLAGTLNEEQASYVNIIMEKGQALLKLISSILDYSQIYAGKVRLNFESMELLELISSAVSSIVPQATKKGVTLKVDLPHVMEPVMGDRDRLQQAVINLLSNALKFTPQGGTVSVTLTDIDYQPDVKTTGYTITIEDSGVGIPADELSKIFQSFYQVDSSSTREYGGAGIGLALVKSFIEGHGGVVRVSSNVGSGSCFTLILPEAPRIQAPVSISPPVHVSMAAAIEDRF